MDVPISVLYYNISEYLDQRTLVFYYYPMYNVSYLLHTQWQRYKDYLNLLPKSIWLSVWGLRLVRLS